MADVFTWKINNLKRRLEDGTVFNISWTLEGSTQGIYVSVIDGATDLPAPDPGSFIPYDNITEEIAIAWVNSILGSEQILEMQAAIDEELNAKANPSIGNGLPWQPTYIPDVTNGIPAPFVDPD